MSPNLWHSFVSILGPPKSGLRYFCRSHILSQNNAHSIMRVLNVAEKNDAAKNIAALLSQGTARMRKGLGVYNKIYEFDYHIFGQNCRMVMTSVSGHLMNYEFSAAFRAWNSCNPVSLFEAPISKQCMPDFQNIKRTLEQEIRTSTKLIIWTDCDREGENIGFEIIEVCTSTKPNIQVYRAKFSEITHQSIVRAIQTLGEPNRNVSNAVDVRQELDLRIGAAFTRFQTLHLKRTFPNELGENLISYGSCQFPTLGFVVERFKAIIDFVEESFWKIKVTHIKDDLSVEFNWKRARLFNELSCQVLYDTCLEQPTANVESVESKPKIKWRPRPLDTVELEKLASRKLRINAKETMRVAEKLYTQGLISYPRTETNIFPKELNLVPLVESQVESPVWGGFAERVLAEGPDPFQGNKSDQAHPPIHPTKYSGHLDGNEKRIYEFIVRHFLACLSKHAEGLETVVDIDIAGEKFVAKGLMIVAKNYLDVYPYDKWTATEIHIYQRGDTFTPEIEMVSGETSPPPLLTEADLISLMEKHGIGTDATHADHIETIKNRSYVGLRDNTHFVPCTLGMALVEGYDLMGFEMSKPHLRAELESDLKRICEGTAQPGEVLARQILRYKNVFESAQQQVWRLNEAIQTHMQLQANPDAAPAPEFENQNIKVKKCACGLDMILRAKKDNGGWYISCVGYPGCREVLWFPTMVQDVTVTTDTCPDCGPDTRLIRFKFERGACYLPQNYVGCIGGCDANLLEILNISARSQQNVSTNARRQPNAPTNARPQRSALINSQSARFGVTGTEHGSVVVNELRSNLTRVHQQAPARDVDPTPGDDSGFESFNNSSTSASNVNCNCGRPAVRLTVKKPGPNLGRQFYKCDVTPNHRTCDFFKWADGVDNNSVTVEDTFTRFADRYSNDRENHGKSAQRNQSNENLRNCFCALPCKRLLVMKDGPNKGRSFYCCSKPMSDSQRCGFFEWCGDEAVDPSVNDHLIPADNNSWNSRNKSQPGRGGFHNGWNKKKGNCKTGDSDKGTRKCSVCGQSVKPPFGEH